MTSFTFTTEREVTLDHLLRNEWQAGKKLIHSLRMDKAVTLKSGEPADWIAPIPAGEQLRFSFPDAVSSYAEDDIPVTVLYEDEHLIAVDKPRGMAVHPDQDGGRGTLMNAVMHDLQSRGLRYAEHVNRLDKGTAGIVLIAKHPIAKSALDRLFEQMEVERVYEAEVDGRMKRPRGTLQYPIGRDRHHPVRRRVSPQGAAAVTHFTVIERKNDSTIVELRLQTGRTHQIRVHLSHIGHPVTGDTLYGGSPTEDGFYRLTARKVAFTHPFTNENITIETD